MGIGVTFGAGGIHFLFHGPGFGLQAVMVHIGPRHGLFHHHLYRVGHGVRRPSCLLFFRFLGTFLQQLHQTARPQQGREQEQHKQDNRPERKTHGGTVSCPCTGRKRGLEKVFSRAMLCGHPFFQPKETA